MNSQKKQFGLAILLIAIGIAWLLNVCNIIPDINWIWTVGLGVAGILILAIAGINQVSFLVGPILITSAILSALRQTGILKLDIEVPILVITFGVLLLLSYLFKLPPPRYLLQKDEKDNSK